MKNKFGLGLVVLAATLSSTALADPRHDSEPSLQGFADPTGVIGTLNINGRTDPRNAFFRSLGTNGRSCSSCHVADQAFSISPPDIRARFEHTHGRDPLFAAFDGANCPNARDGDAAARSLLLRSGLIRVGLPCRRTRSSRSARARPYGCARPDPKGGLHRLVRIAGCCRRRTCPS
jgi:hypothetical protein